MNDPPGEMVGIIDIIATSKQDHFSVILLYYIVLQLATFERDRRPRLNLFASGRKAMLCPHTALMKKFQKRTEYLVFGPVEYHQFFQRSLGGEIQ
jgi:hypothetical protein